MDEEVVRFLNRVAVNKDELQVQLIDTLQKTVAVLTKQRDEAINHIAGWVAAVVTGGTDWDYWDDYYKDVMCSKDKLPSIREQLEIAIEKEIKRQKR